MRAKMLLLLAEHLSSVNPDDYSIVSYHKDALFHATHVPEIHKAGFKLVERANEPGGMIAAYKNATDVEAASVFFDITNIEAQYLFGEREIDINGRPRKSPCTTTLYGGYSRDKEGPSWTAIRIKCFVRDRKLDYMAPLDKVA